MTSTRPQGERAHTPHPDVTIVTTTSSLLSGPQESPVGAEVISVNQPDSNGRESKPISLVTNKYPYIFWHLDNHSRKLNTSVLDSKNPYPLSNSSHLHTLSSLRPPPHSSKLILPVDRPRCPSSLSVCLLLVSIASVSAGLGHG